MTEEPDIEALQAQIELSTSVAYDLVSSWMKPAVPSSKESISDTISRELEEFAKRPHRLGLGATVSKAKAATALEATKLKGKLIGRKRPRDEDGSVSTIGKTTMADDSDEEGESRTAAISKNPEKARLLFVNEKANKGKAKAQGTNSNIKDHDQDFKNKDSEGENRSMKPNPFVIPKIPPSHSLNREPSPLLDNPSPSKKRRKKKKKNREETDKQGSKGDIEEEWTGFGDSFRDPAVSSIISADELEESTVDPTSITMLNGSAALSTPSEESSSLAKTFMGAISSKPVSVLNLDGPPVPNSFTGPKKKRRHRRKNKNKQETGGVEEITL